MFFGVILTKKFLFQAFMVNLVRVHVLNTHPNSCKCSFLPSTLQTILSDSRLSRAKFKNIHTHTQILFAF